MKITEGLGNLGLPLIAGGIVVGLAAGFVYELQNQRNQYLAKIAKAAQKAINATFKG